MSWLAIVLIVLAAIVLLLLAGGAIAVQRRNAERRARLLGDIAAANEALALARAQDRGWDRDTIDAAARAAHLARRPNAEIRAIHLVQVVDRPGTEDDQAKLRVIDDEGEHDVLLGRHGDAWAALS